MVADVSPGPEPSDLGVLTNINGVLFFYADDGVHGYELWALDTTAGPIPAVSDWGLVVTTLLLMSGGSIVIGRRRRPTV